MEVFIWTEEAFDGHHGYLRGGVIEFQMDHSLLLKEYIKWGIVMFYSGLLSVSFRGKSAEQIVKEAKENGLKFIEWGSDVHVPIRDDERLQEVVALQKEYGISCCSYGTYFYLGEDSLEDLPEYIRNAKALGTDILRLWAGKKNPDLYTEEEKQAFFQECRKAAKIAEEANVTLCLECHNHTYTENKDSALEIMEAVNSPAFKMYWQPGTDKSIEDNIEYLRLIKKWIVHIHVYHWENQKPVPLENGRQHWLTYMKEFDDDRYFLMEFMPDSAPDRLAIQTATLQSFIACF